MGEGLIMQQLSGQDATFLYLESPGAHLHLTGLYVYQQPAGKNRLDHAAICGLITAALEGVAELRQKLLRPPLDIDYPIWVDDPDFDITEHLYRHSGPPPRDQSALFEAVADIHAEAMDMSRAPWEMHIIERLDGIAGFPQCCFAIVMKYHHTAIDGASGAALIGRLHGITGAEPVKVKRAMAPPGTARLLLGAAVNNVINVAALTRSLAKAAPGVLRNFLTEPSIHAPARSPVPDTRFNQPVSSRRVMHATTISQQRLRAVRLAVPGATFNDVLLTLCGGALRQWLLHHDELPAGSLVAMVPVNTRNEAEQQLSGNRISSLFLPIGSHIENPLERLHMVHSASRHAKSERGGIMNPRQVSEITRSIPALPLSLTAHLITGFGLAWRGIRLCNCTITNVPAHHANLHLGPAALVGIFGNGPLLDGMGLIISMFSYAGNTSLCFTSCPEMLPNPAELSSGVEAELASLEREVQRSS